MHFSPYAMQQPKNNSDKVSLVSPRYLELELDRFKICYDETSQIIVYVSKTDPILFFHSLSDLSFFPVKLSTPITFIPKGEVESVSFSIDRRFVSVLRNSSVIDMYNLVDPKHQCISIDLKSKEAIITQGVGWTHSRKEAGSKNVYAPVLTVATNKSLSFYEISLRSASLIKSVKMSVSILWVNKTNQLSIASDSSSTRLSVYTVKDLGVQKLQSLTLPEVPTRNNTFISTLYRATYLYQYSEQRARLFVFVFSNIKNEFIYFNVVALPSSGPCRFTTADNLIIVHFLVAKQSFLIDVADIPYDSSSSITTSSPLSTAVSPLVVKNYADAVEKEEIMKDPLFCGEHEEERGYCSYEIQITSNSIGLELEPSFQRLFISSLDGRVHNCLDNSAYVKNYTSTISPMVKSQIQLGSYITHINDNIVIGNSFSSVLTILRDQKRPIRIRLEKGINEEDPYRYRGESPIKAVLSFTDERVDIFSSEYYFFNNNVVLDLNRGILFNLHFVLLPSKSLSPADSAESIRFLLRRRNCVPTLSNQGYDAKVEPSNLYVRSLIHESIQQNMQRYLENNLLNSVFDSINKDYVMLLKRGDASAEVEKYIEKSTAQFSTYELSGNIVIPQAEMIEKVYMPLQGSLSLKAYQLLLLCYVQSLLRAQVLITNLLSRHMKEKFLESDLNDNVLLFLYKNGLLPQDVESARMHVVKDSGKDALTVELSLQVLRGKGDYETLMNYYYRKQSLTNVLCLLGKHYDTMKEKNTWLLNIINLATILYDDSNSISPVYQVFYFIQHYQKDLLEGVQYANRLGGLIDFAEVETGELDGVPSKGEAMKSVLQQVKEAIVLRMMN